ncbi:zinc ABC transporter substrate-binding protein [Campylobacter sp. MIT 21-1685]|uniref:metal ABC transporter solute-binding protein, Zn/Mn family n=1 Tax=unclassified Campylobacter TaxID=2593542 RepID=UPI00224B952F|nr:MULTISPECIES: zinc ABC transporter substrate-binding protein [unclassified Campylobacter]MCX2683776.1 zinc ABC transporter substrate-binding protein [Campylobacter sp. MIT 21-1684]MCX2752049.1 zinc ABC transporter substrate-binding protein [Campylobacter sp. MIT 21-1682]MCX2808253.1 zinc ABC transporter substrate-binding protein [Campylobacter sp. MIT 21-1685]
MKQLILLSLICIFLYSKPLVSVSIAPQAFFVEKIANDTVNVNILLPQNVDEHTFEFKPNTLKQLEKSDIYFTVGLEFEKIFNDKFHRNFPKLRFVNSQENISLVAIKDTHSHKEDKDEKHTNLDIHTWLDPILVQTMAMNIFKALAQQYPEHKAFYETNLNTFLAELDSLNLQIASKLRTIKNRKFIVYHPSWGYFASRYNLEQIPVEIEGKEPKLKDLQELIQEAKEENVKVIFVQPGFPENAVKVLSKELDAHIVQINHLARAWESELLKSVDQLATNLQ